MLSNNKCQENYFSAKGALNNIARSRKASDAQKKKARKARTRLTLDFINQNIIEVEERTEQFRQFINVIEKAIKSIGKDSPIKALKTLKTIAENSHKLIGSKNRKNPKIP